jgi:multiple antibiotic resistance protein
MVAYFQSLSLALVAVFVALDIIGTLPLYISMTHEMEDGARRRVLDTSMIVAFVVALIFLFFGVTIFRFLGITISDFKIAGGLVLLLVSLADLLAGPDAVRHKPASTGIVPLAVPLITGPGVLTTLILQAGSVGYVFTLIALILNYGFAWFLLRRAERVTGLIGRDGTVVASKIAALLLAAIAVAMIRSGIFELVRAF